MLRKLRTEISEIKQLVSSINTALIVREPGTAVAAEAYDGLRRQVAQATAERRAHLVELVRLLEALDSGVSGDSLQRLVQEWANQAGLERWPDPEPREFFEVMGDGDGPVEVVHPAWVAAGPETVLVKPGLLRRRDATAAADETDRPASHETPAKEES